MNQGLGLFLVEGAVCGDLVIENGQLKFDRYYNHGELIDLKDKQGINDEILFMPPVKMPEFTFLGGQKHLAKIDYYKEIEWHS